MVGKDGAGASEMELVRLCDSSEPERSLLGSVDEGIGIETLEP